MKKSFSKAIMKNLNHGTFKWGHRETFKVAYGNIIKIKILKCTNPNLVNDFLAVSSHANTSICNTLKIL